MSQQTADAIQANYLKDIARELADLPRAQRDDLLDQIRQHLLEARRLSDPTSDLVVLNAIERLGDANDLAADARERLGAIRGPRRIGAREWITLGMLSIGGILLPLIGWLVGISLLWSSTKWSVRERIIGSLAPPGGGGMYLFLLVEVSRLFAAPGTVCSASHKVCPATGPPGWLPPASILVWICLLCLPFATAAYLADRLGRRHLVHAADISAPLA